MSGYVYDKKENIPLQGAFVYLDGTTISASTDSLGYFSITVKEKFNTDLIVSYIGYSNFTVSNPFQYTKPMKILMQEAVTKLDGLVISKEKSPFSREDMLEVFKENFLGNSRAAQSCQIANEDVIAFYFDKETNILYAKSYEPLQIRNNYLKYNVLFNLTNFGVKYTKVTLDRRYQQAVYFAGTSFYKDISGSTSAYKERRASYLGSITHLMRTLAADKWEDEKFGLYVNGMKADPKEYFKIKDTLGVKKITVLQGVEKAKPLNINVSGESVNDLKEKQKRYRKRQGVIYFTVVYDGKESYFTCPKGVFYIDNNGQYFPISNVRFEGYMSEFKAGDMLPADYSYRF
ncbi:hypothetical protein GCM10007424_09840 [Flavobacterium suaedae]|uniref:Carboxypeptidase-like regulatory domain-containing protein n=1 Tax=Flavobacterium suaedae TaxID=1767027 RepID=A0ABQ1JM94_9FLAO|nr:hypothetical protein GCM10007424_09840 [Flavobacterium suaedae]